jgi:ferredoxin
VYLVLCNHCKEAVCVKVCPSEATIQREDLWEKWLGGSGKGVRDMILFDK